MPTIDPQRGEVWLVNLDPSQGAEMRKSRPAVVLSRNAIRKLPLRFVVPITEMQPHFGSQSWKVPIAPDVGNGLTKPSAADALQARGVDLGRFAKRIGILPDTMLDDIALAVALMIDYKF